MSVTRLRLLGSYDVVDQSGLAIPLPNSCRPLVGYLVANRGRHLDRAHIAETIWPDLESRRARRCLSTALWRLKAAPAMANLLDLDSPSQVALNMTARIHVDVVVFERRAEALLAARQSPPKNTLQRAVRALALYQDDAYQRIDAEWADLERERLRLMYVEALSVVASVAKARGDYDEAIKHGARLAILEPLREDIHRLLMRAYMARGARAQAIAQYRICQGELASALGIEPMDDTRQLYETLVARPDRRPAPEAEQRWRALVSAVSARLQTARAASSTTTQRIEQALSLLDRSGD